jgi:hypothetical protein
MPFSVYVLTIIKFCSIVKVMNGSSKEGNAE